MNSLFTVTLVVCAASLICTILSAFITSGGTKKIVNLVMGAFIICSLIMPVKSTINSFSSNISEQKPAEEQTASCDEIMSNYVVEQTKTNLETAAKDILKQNGIQADKCEVILAQTEDNSIIISSISIYLDSEQNSFDAVEIIEKNFSITPVIITEQVE